MDPSSARTAPGVHARLGPRIVAIALATTLGCDAPHPDGASVIRPDEPRGSECTPTRPVEPSLDPTALELIAALGCSPHEISWHGDELITPVQLPALLKLGTRAVPTILQAIETTTDDWTRDCLIEVAGRLGDRRARPVLERMLEADT